MPGTREAEHAEIKMLHGHTRAFVFDRLCGYLRSSKRSVYPPT